jgi:triphosphoribosyl-dephospho-CoA synthase
MSDVLTKVAPVKSVIAEAVGRPALEALATEAALHPKPGLVSPVDSGAHDDMDYGTFQRSIAALRDYFPAVAAAGAAGCDFDVLKRLGMDAERRMLAATGGVNTHRGAVFSLGLLAAAAGWRRARGLPITGPDLGDVVAMLWGEAISAATTQAPDSHGLRVMRRYGATGAREEAATGFPTLFRVALPALHDAAMRFSTGKALIQTLFAIMAELEDTNLLHRGGPAGLAFAQDGARAFLAAGGVAAPDWRGRALALHRDFIARRLSPGGAADMLAAAWFVYRLSRE